MAVLPRPNEPDLETLREEAKNYESGINSFLGGDNDIKDEIMAKQGMIEYLHSEWEIESISYREIQKATGDVDWLIEAWLVDDENWKTVLAKYEDVLGVNIE